MRLDGQAATPQEDAGKTAAQRSKRRCREISDRRMAAGREVLEVFQDAGVYSKAADDLHAASAPSTNLRPSTQAAHNVKTPKIS